jgi:hypothetical protein
MAVSCNALNVQTQMWMNTSRAKASAVHNSSRDGSPSIVVLTLVSGSACYLFVRGIACCTTNSNSWHQCGQLCCCTLTYQWFIVARLVVQ